MGFGAVAHDLFISLDGDNSGTVSFDEFYKVQVTRDMMRYENKQLRKWQKRAATPQAESCSESKSEPKPRRAGRRSRPKA